MGTPTMWKRETLKSENGVDPDINVQLVRRAIAIARLQALYTLEEEGVKARSRTPTVKLQRQTPSLVKARSRTPEALSVQHVIWDMPFVIASIYIMRKLRSGGNQTLEQLNS